VEASLTNGAAAIQSPCGEQVNQQWTSSPPATAQPLLLGITARDVHQEARAVIGILRLLWGVALDRLVHLGGELPGNDARADGSVEISTSSDVKSG
jgi:hypothetical protein